MKSLLTNLVRHMRWADALVADALDGAPAADAKTIRLFGHIASVEHLWYARIQGRPAEYPVWPELTVAASRTIAAQHADLLQRLVAEGDASALSRIVHYRNSAGNDFANPVTDIVTQIAMHGSHHRGQIAQQLRASGLEPPSVDYIQFIRRDEQR